MAGTFEWAPALHGARECATGMDPVMSSADFREEPPGTCDVCGLDGLDLCPYCGICSTCVCFCSTPAPICARCGRATKPCPNCGQCHRCGCYPAAHEPDDDRDHVPWEG